MTGESGRLAIVEDGAALLDQLTWALKGRFELFKAADAPQGLSLAEHDPDVFLLDLRLPPSNEAEEGLKRQLRLIHRLKQQRLRTRLLKRQLRLIHQPKQQHPMLAISACWRVIQPI